jgi:HEAT repeat protein
MPSESTSPVPPQKSFGGRWTYAILITAFLFVLMPFMFWNMTWFGRPMTDAQISKAFADRAHPRETQHALSQIESRMESGDPSVRRWYPQLLALTANPVDEIRVTDAWVMGQDTSSPDLRDALIKLLADSNPMVQRNAALSLVRFKDDSGHAQLLAMLRPYEMLSPFAGTLETRLKPGDVVNPGTLVARVVSNGERREVRARVPGTLDRWLVADKTSITDGQPILSLAPSDNMVWESLRALYLVGRAEDLPDVHRFLRSASPQIAQQADATSRAIRSLSSS